MTEEIETIDVVGIKFRNRGKRYDFDPAGLAPQEGDKVVVETSKGLELGTVVRKPYAIPVSQAVQPLRSLVRIATEDDLRIEALCRAREREAYVIGRQKIAAHGLEMKLIDVECSFEGNKILFFFSSDGRVDFRDLVRDLASVFHTRIELRQIGVRDEARMLGGLGVCGRPFCCGTFMDEFAPVSTKMAKIQSMSLNPAKISGCCGRLMCCLRYEHEAYEELVRNVPKNGAFVETPDGYGNVTQVNVLRQTVKVKLDGPGDDTFRSYEADEVAAVPGGRPRDGSQPPHVLVLKPKAPKEPEEDEDTGWELPDRLIASAGESASTVRQEMNRRAGQSPRPRTEKRPAEGAGRNSRRKKSGQPRQENAENAGRQAPEKKEDAARKRGRSHGSRHPQQGRQQTQEKKETAATKQDRSGTAHEKKSVPVRQDRSGAAGKTAPAAASEKSAAPAAAGSKKRSRTDNKRRHNARQQAGGGHPAQQEDRS